jgi:glycogen operon protein
VFRRLSFFTGDRVGGGAPDIAWLRPDGSQLSDGDWSNARVMGVFLNGQAITDPGPRGERIADDSFLLLLNPSSEDVTMTLPGHPFGDRWHVVVDTGSGQVPNRCGGEAVPAGTSRPVTAHTLVLLRRGVTEPRR